MTQHKSRSDDGMRVSPTAPRVNPGDAAPSRNARHGGEPVPPTAKGSARLGKTPCKTCSGTGKVIEGIGGA
jgi:hypothetical protein